jgi:hypothetical protein
MDLDNMKRTTTRERIGKAVSTLAVLLMCSWFVPSANANPYLFSVTAAQIESALQTSMDPNLYNESGFFAIFIQPDPAIVSSYTYLEVDSPNQNATNAWEATTITDPSSPNLGAGTWAQFSKQPGQTTVALLSQANNGGTSANNIFLNHSFHDNVGAPYGWGTTPATVTSIFSDSTVFSFWIDTPQTLSLTSTIHLSGKASAIESGSSSSFTFDTKEQDGISFSLNIAPSLPEPSTWTLFLGGAVLLLGTRHYQSKKSRSRASRSR